MRELEGNTNGHHAKLRQCWVYEIRVDGVIRYIGKGRNGRIYSHLIDAKRTASRSDVKIRNLFPHFRKMLVSAVRRGSHIAEKIVASNLTDGEAYRMEWQMIWNYHKHHAGQLWNTIQSLYRSLGPLGFFNGVDDFAKAGVTSDITGGSARSSDRKLKPLPPDPFRHQESAIAPRMQDLEL